MNTITRDYTKYAITTAQDDLMIAKPVTLAVYQLGMSFVRVRTTLCPGTHDRVLCHSTIELKKSGIVMRPLLRILA